MNKSPRPLIDIGVNLAGDAFDNDREQVLHRARQAGVEQCVLTGADLNTSEAVARLCDDYRSQFPDMLYCTAGIHPHDAKTFTNESLASLRELAALAQVKAIGETGLDFNRNFSDPRDQERAFEAQLQLAAELKMPVFMHERDAHQRQFEILKNYRDHLVDGVIHCFTGNQQALFRYLDLDLHIGVTGWICDERRGQPLQQIVSNIPLNRLMLETDAPYLLPRTMAPKPKSRRNEPAFLPWVLDEIGKHRTEAPEQIAIATSETARRFFRIDCAR